MCIPPSFSQGFARSGGESAYPGLWDDLAAWYEPGLGVQGNTLWDHSGYARHGALTAADVASVWTTGEGGWAVTYDGSDDEFSLGSALGLGAANATVFCWFSLTGTSLKGAFWKVGT